MKNSVKYSITGNENLDENDIDNLNLARDYFNNEKAEIKKKHKEVPLLTELKNWGLIPTVSIQ